MAYSTGSATTTNQIIDTINAFAAANGWTINLAAADGSNKRLHIQKNSVYANFSSNYNTGSALFGLQGSSGFSGAAAWNAQPTPRSSTMQCDLTVNSSAILPCTYHLFAQHTPDLLAGVFVSANNTVTYFMVGELDKAGAYTGGDFYAAGDFMYQVGAGPSSNQPVSTTIQLKTPTAFIGAYSYGFLAGVDNDTGMAPLMPVRLFENVSGKYKPRGSIPCARALARAYANGDDIVYGSDTWKAFYTSYNLSAIMVAFKK